MGLPRAPLSPPIKRPQTLVETRELPWFGGEWEEMEVGNEGSPCSSVKPRSLGGGGVGDMEASIVDVLGNGSWSRTLSSRVNGVASCFRDISDTLWERIDDWKIS